MSMMDMNGSLNKCPTSSPLTTIPRWSCAPLASNVVASPHSLRHHLKSCKRRLSHLKSFSACLRLPLLAATRTRGCIQSLVLRPVNPTPLECRLHPPIHHLFIPDTRKSRPSPFPSSDGFSFRMPSSSNNGQGFGGNVTNGSMSSTITPANAGNPKPVQLDDVRKLQLHNQISHHQSMLAALESQAKEMGLAL